MAMKGDPYGKRTLDFVERLQKLTDYEAICREIKKELEWFGLICVTAWSMPGPGRPPRAYSSTIDRATTRAVEGRDDVAAGIAGWARPDVAAIAEQIRSTGRPVLIEGEAASRGRFLLDNDAARQRELRRFALSGPGPEIAASLLDGDAVNFLGDQIFVKEPGTRERTAFHQDAGYLEIDGEQCCAL